MDLLQFLVLLCMKHNFFVRACHVLGVSNEIADALSCFQVSHFRAAAPTANKPLAPSRLRYDPLKDEVLMYANWGLAWTTNSTYATGEKQFIQFCLVNRLISSEGDILPASEGTLIYFTSYLARKVKQYHQTLFGCSTQSPYFPWAWGLPKG